jgi:hypothetical protein
VTCACLLSFMTILCSVDTNRAPNFLPVASALEASLSSTHSILWDKRLQQWCKETEDFTLHCKMTHGYMHSGVYTSARMHTHSSCHPSSAQEAHQLCLDKNLPPALTPTRGPRWGAWGFHLSICSPSTASAIKVLPKVKCSCNRRALTGRGTAHL